MYCTKNGVRKYDNWINGTKLEFVLAGMKRIVNLSEGVRESLRRLSNVTWMAEELLKVADYFQPNKWVSGIKTC